MTVNLKDLILLIILLFGFSDQAFCATNTELLKKQLKAMQAETDKANAIDDGSIIFEGKITTSSVNRFIKKHQNTSATLIHLGSHGGDIESALKLANWMLDKSFDVKVNVCFSACANYLFLAGKRKLIWPHGILMWHGGMWQTDFAENYTKHKQFAAQLTKEKWRKLSRTKKTEFLNEARYQASYKRTRDKEDKFVARVGVSEYLFRLGQEPIWYEPDCWSASPDVLKKLGVTGLESEDRYSRLETLDDPIAKMLCQGQGMTFILNEAGEIQPVRK